ncbi:MAG: CRTAC1 family protein, partial [Flavobacteriaceae bacterium]
MIRKFTFTVLLLFISCSKQEKSTTLFEELNPNDTGVFFQNEITEGPNTNVLMYEYFYNGAGIALADFNGDKKLDLYMTSNMGENKMYLNKGGFEFEDITSISQTQGRKGPWKTGVTAVDINGDQRMDLYVCYSGAVKEASRKNQLFLNMGNNEDGKPLFTETAALFGLDSPGYSNQGHFFDYDKDGDLDMILLNHNPKSLPVLSVAKTKVLLKNDDPMTGLRIYEQRDRYFYDVTSATNINGSSLSYGLGLALSDFNNDGWIDFYVSNDYTIPDYLYINNQKGGFENVLKSSMPHTSHFSMGNDTGDINNDGLMDLMTLDMLPEDNKRQKLLKAPDNYNLFDLNLKSGFHYQYMRNMLQKNNGDGTFSEIGQMMGVSNTDWSWSALFADYDNDGWQDLFVSNGYKRDYTNRDFLNYMEDFIGTKNANLTREDVLEIINNMPASNVSNYIYANRAGERFVDQTEAWGLKSFKNSNGAAYGDLDNDGDLDLVVNNINLPLSIYKNNSQDQKNHLQIELLGDKANRLAIGSKVKIYIQESFQTKEQFTSRGYLSSVSPILNFGLGNAQIIDSLVVQ